MKYFLVALLTIFAVNASAVQYSSEVSPIQLEEDRATLKDLKETIGANFNEIRKRLRNGDYGFETQALADEMSMALYQATVIEPDLSHLGKMTKLEKDIKLKKYKSLMGHSIGEAFRLEEAILSKNEGMAIEAVRELRDLRTKAHDVFRP